MKRKVKNGHWVVLKTKGLYNRSPRFDLSSRNKIKIYTVCHCKSWIHETLKFFIKGKSHLSHLPVAYSFPLPSCRISINIQKLMQPLKCLSLKLTIHIDIHITKQLCPHLFLCLIWIGCHLPNVYWRINILCIWDSSYRDSYSDKWVK